MNRSLLDVGGAALIVSQFTLAAETKGNRPGFSTAAAPEEGGRLYGHFVDHRRRWRRRGHRHLRRRYAGPPGDDGPVTIWLDTASG